MYNLYIMNTLNIVYNLFIMNTLNRLYMMFIMNIKNAVSPLVARVDGVLMICYAFI